MTQTAICDMKIHTKRNEVNETTWQKNKEAGKDDIKWYGRRGNVSTHRPSTWTSSPWNLLVHSCIRRSPPCKCPPRSVGHVHKKYKLRPQQAVACELNYVLWKLCERILHITWTQTFPECEPRFSWAYVSPPKGQSRVQENSRSGPSGLPKYRTCHAWEGLLRFMRFNGQVITTHGFLPLFLEKRCNGDDKRYGGQRRPASWAYQF